MNYVHQKKLVLLSRNEGKIKTFESCFDLRAWSHDITKRNLYLREWIKSDMCTCMIPIYNLSGLLKANACKNLRLLPRCQPNCKSKFLLESICCSCRTMKDCFKDNDNLEKYFQEEELETSHWPCEKCLSALKSIKMFWKIIAEKVLNVNITKNEAVQTHSSRLNGIRNIAKAWQKEIIEQTAYVKSCIQTLNSNSFLRKNTKFAEGDDTSLNVDNTHGLSHVETPNEEPHYEPKSITRFKGQGSTRHKYRNNHLVQKSSGFTCTSTVKLSDTGCNPCSEGINEKLKAYRYHLKKLHEKFKMQTNEIEMLKKENSTLKSGFFDVYQKYSRHSLQRTPKLLSPISDLTETLKPFETNSDESIHVDTTKCIDSEVTITVKKCKNETFRHVCTLQVVHKTNGPTLGDFTSKKQRNQKEDPIDLLTKVQNIFGSIVTKEMSIINERRTNRMDINATYKENN